jgi:Rieske Fe-S protein
MNPCSVCGNVYDKSFEVLLAGKTYVFDSFECAIHALAPVCAHCGCRVIGHGLEADGKVYCCVHCAQKQGEDRLRDRA